MVVGTKQRTCSMQRTSRNGATLPFFPTSPAPHPPITHHSNCEASPALHLSRLALQRLHRPRSVLAPRVSQPESPVTAAAPREHSPVGAHNGRVCATGSHAMHFHIQQLHDEAGGLEAGGVPMPKPAVLSTSPAVQTPSVCQAGKQPRQPKPQQQHGEQRRPLPSACSVRGSHRKPAKPAIPASQTHTGQAYL